MPPKKHLTNVKPLFAIIYDKKTLILRRIFCFHTNRILFFVFWSGKFYLEKLFIKTFKRNKILFFNENKNEIHNKINEIQILAKYLKTNVISYEKAPNRIFSFFFFYIQ